MRLKTGLSAFPSHYVFLKIRFSGTRPLPRAKARHFASMLPCYFLLVSNSSYEAETLSLKLGGDHRSSSGLLGINVDTRRDIGPDSLSCIKLSMGKIETDHFPNQALAGGGKYFRARFTGPMIRGDRIHRAQNTVIGR